MSSGAGRAPIAGEPARRAGSRRARSSCDAGDRRVALVSVDLFAAPGGLVKDAAARAPRGYSERNVLVSASHTHSGPGGFANFDTFNTVAPSVETIGDPSPFVELLAPAPADPRLYGFLVDRIATAIRRADRDLAPAAVGWGRERLTSVTRNRSLEAHLADHGRTLEPGAGRPADDPKGPAHTIDPGVDVLRVDHVRGGRRVPIGAWSNFANHGTVNPSDFQVYTQDHHGPASRTLEGAIRKRAGLPAGASVVNVYGNGNEGDQSAGLDGQGPADRRSRRDERRDARCSAPGPTPAARSAAGRSSTCAGPASAFAARR